MPVSIYACSITQHTPQHMLHVYSDVVHQDLVMHCIRVIYSSLRTLGKIDGAMELCSSAVFWLVTIADIGWPFPIPLAIVTTSGTTPAYKLYTCDSVQEIHIQREMEIEQHTHLAWAECAEWIASHLVAQTSKNVCLLSQTPPVSHQRCKDHLPHGHT